LWEAKEVRITSIIMLLVDVVYFWFVSGALFTTEPITCEAKQALFYNERNAYMCGMSIFLFFILHRLVDVQKKLFVSRQEVKRNTAQTEFIKKED
jgi:hypothetical protein